MTDAEMESHPYEALTPECVMEAVESLGYVCDARLLALNSYENRVYQVGLEDETPIIAKFYRPGRWSQAQILEEHAFARELVEADISVVAPVADSHGYTLGQYAGFRFAVFERRGGHPPELDNPDNLLVLGRTLGRIHAVGQSQRFERRLSLTRERWLNDSYQFVAEHCVPMDLRTAYITLVEDLEQRVNESWHEAQTIRCHGDCHVGNILWRDDVAHFVDLDDCVMAPAIQDLWMFLSGDRQQQLAQLDELLAGYEEFCEFQPSQLALVECLRTLRIVHYAAWLGRRWSDPAFPKSFPWFGDARYWSSHILELREQVAAFDQPPLSLYP
ncbi:MAG: serine/threonine protein kinase [Pseudomonadota bacterium]